MAFEIWLHEIVSLMRPVIGRILYVLASMHCHNIMKIRYYNQASNIPNHVLRKTAVAMCENKSRVRFVLQVME